MDFNELWENTSSPVSIVCRNGEADSLQRLLDMKKPVDRSDNRGYKPIHEAVVNNHIACVKLLINNGDTDLNWQTHEGETPLVLATKNGHEEMIKVLLEAKADSNCRTNFKEIPLHFAVSGRLLNAVNDLIAAGSDVNAADYGNETALHMAVQKKSLEMVGVLLNHKAKMRPKDDFGRNAVFMAAENGSSNILAHLLDRLPTKNLPRLVNAATTDGTTPVMIAAQNGHADCLQVLIDHGANHKKLSLENNSAMEMAINQGRFDCFEILYLLVEEKQVFKECTAYTQCLLHMLVHARRYESKIFHFLMTNGYRLKWCAPRTSSETAVPGLNFYKGTCNIGHGYEDTVQLTVLISAMVAKNRSYVDDILEIGGKDLNAGYERLPVNFAHPLSLCGSNPELAERLLKNGANPNYPLNIQNDACPFVMQMSLDHPKLMLKLIKYGGDVGNCFLKCTGNRMIFVGNEPGHKCLNQIVKCFLGPNYCLVSLRDNDRYYLKLFPKGIPDVKELECTSLDKSFCVDIKMDCISLRHLCRRVIVRRVLEATKWSVLKDSLPKLQLPPHITNYLLYDDL